VLRREAEIMPPAACVLLATYPGLSSSLHSISFHLTQGIEWPCRGESIPTFLAEDSRIHKVGLVEGNEKQREINRRLTVSATLTLSFLSFNKLATSNTIALTFSGGNSFAVGILHANLLFPVT
jgi:hypothetical protein